MSIPMNVVRDRPKGRIIDKTLLDEFAGLAMLGLSNNEQSARMSCEDIATKAYDLAEAMLQERERRSQ